MTLEDVLSTNPESNSQLQINCIKKLQEILIEDYVENIIIDNQFHIGVRGDYEGKPNYMMYFRFTYMDYLFEFYLAYDQLEFYIAKDGKLAKECNLEDFWDDETLLSKFINYFIKGIDALNIVRNII